jgi:putative transcription antitermination factor YqgF
MKRVLAVDPGEKNIGLALSDPTGTIASPLQVLKHVSRAVDAAAIAQIAVEHDSGKIIVGQALDSEGNPGPAARHAARLADAIRTQTDLPVLCGMRAGLPRQPDQQQLLLAYHVGSVRATWTKSRQR